MLLHLHICRTLSWRRLSSSPRLSSRLWEARVRLMKPSISYTCWPSATANSFLRRATPRSWATAVRGGVWSQLWSSQRSVRTRPGRDQTRAPAHTHSSSLTLYNNSTWLENKWKNNGQRHRQIMHFSNTYYYTEVTCLGRIQSRVIIIN